jgi:hypothetical protein
MPSREIEDFIARWSAVSSVAFAPDGCALLITEQSTNGPVTLIKPSPGFEQTDPHP